MKLSKDIIISYMKAHVSEKRFHHCEQVAEMAVQLSEKFEVDPSKAWQAGILHDVCRECRPDLLLQLADKFGILIDDIERAEPLLLHGSVGASLLTSELSVNDPEILEAVALHITGNQKMSRLAQLIFVADFVEPGRSFEAAVQLRELLPRLTPEEILLKVYQRTIHYVIAQNYLVHPRTIAGWNELIKKGVREIER